MKIRSLEDLRAFSSPDDHVLTLFSGGLDSSYVLHALAQVNCRVTALCVDVGDDVEPSALEATVAHFGAALRIVDAREDFAVKAVLPAIRAQAPECVNDFATPEVMNLLCRAVAFVG
jgi:argininosuccinate synthase